MNPYETIKQHLQRYAMRKNYQPFVPDFSTLHFLRSRKRTTHQLHLITFYDTLKKRQFYMRLLLAQDLFQQNWRVKSSAGGPEPFQFESSETCPLFHPMTVGWVSGTTPFLLGGIIADHDFSIASLRLRMQDGQIIDEDQTEDNLVLFISDKPILPSERDAPVDRFSFQVDFLNGAGEVMFVQSVFV